MSRIELLVKISEADGPVAAGDVDATAARLNELAEKGFVKRATKKGKALTRKATNGDGTPSRGRPAFLFVLDSKGRGAVKRHSNAQKAEEAAGAAPKAAESVEAPAAA